MLTKPVSEMTVEEKRALRVWARTANLLEMAMDPEATMERILGRGGNVVIARPKRRVLAPPRSKRKLKPEQVAEIRARYIAATSGPRKRGARTGGVVKALAAEFRVSEPTIYKAVQGRYPVHDRTAA